MYIAMGGSTIPSVKCDCRENCEPPSTEYWLDRMMLVNPGASAFDTKDKTEVGNVLRKNFMPFEFRVHAVEQSSKRLGILFKLVPVGLQILE